MADVLPKKMDDPANPLQAGDPFKRGNFNRFALGMCLIIAVVLLAAIAFIYSTRNHHVLPAPGSSSRSALQVVWAARA